MMAEHLQTSFVAVRIEWAVELGALGNTIYNPGTFMYCHVLYGLHSTLQSRRIQYQLRPLRRAFHLVI